MDNKDLFAKFWKRNGTNLIVALVITLVLCGLVGSQTATLSVPLWLIIGLVCWGIRSVYVFQKWKRDNAEDE